MLAGGLLGFGMWHVFEHGLPAVKLLNWATPQSELEVQPHAAGPLLELNHAEPAEGRHSAREAVLLAEGPPRVPPVILAQPDAVIPADQVETVRFFDHRPLRLERVLRMRVTAYSPDHRSCGKWADGYTASGYSVWTNAGKLVAADTDLLPFGTIVRVPGYGDGRPVPVLDRGGAIKGHRLDLLFPSHEAALQWGVQEIDVEVWGYADGVASQP